MTSAVELRAGTHAEFASSRLEAVFADCFQRSHNTLLQGGAPEPLYEPATPVRQAILRYRQDYFASALHEIAHWCIAGAERRKHVDFGYWYASEGRTPAQQKAFESVEVKPQALEWFFARACGWRFKISSDNLDPETGLMPDTEHFCFRVTQQAREWAQSGLPERGELYYRALQIAFETHLDSGSQTFSVGDIL